MRATQRQARVETDEPTFLAPVDLGLPWLQQFCYNFYVLNAAVPPNSNGFLVVTKSLSTLCIPCVLNEQDGDLYGHEAQREEAKLYGETGHTGLWPINSMFGRVRVSGVGACQGDEERALTIRTFRPANTTLNAKTPLNSRRDLSFAAGALAGEQPSQDTMC